MHIEIDRQIERLSEREKDVTVEKHSDGVNEREFCGCGNRYKINLEA